MALAAALLGVSATVVMPADAPASKVAATRNYGAKIVAYDRQTQSRPLAERISGEPDFHQVPNDFISVNDFFREIVHDQGNPRRRGWRPASRGFISSARAGQRCLFAMVALVRPDLINNTCPSVTTSVGIPLSGLVACTPATTPKLTISQQYQLLLT